MDIAESIVPKPRPFKIGMTTERLKRYKLSGIDQIPAELIQAMGNTLRFEIHKLINFVLNKEELPQQWKESIIVPVCKKGDKTDCSNHSGI